MTEIERILNDAMALHTINNGSPLRHNDAAPWLYLLAKFPNTYYQNWIKALGFFKNNPTFKPKFVILGSAFDPGRSGWEPLC